MNFDELDRINDNSRIKFHNSRKMEIFASVNEPRSVPFKRGRH